MEGGRDAFAITEFLIDYEYIIDKNYKSVQESFPIQVLNFDDFCKKYTANRE